MCELVTWWLWQMYILLHHWPGLMSYSFAQNLPRSHFLSLEITTNALLAKRNETKNKHLTMAGETCFKQLEGHVGDLQARLHYFNFHLGHQKEIRVL